MTVGGWRPWRAAMADALYGDGGFYRVSGAPGRHFRTAAHTSPVWAAAVAELARRVDAALGSPAEMAVVDMGAGGGELLAGLADLLPARVGLLGVDVAGRPDGLPQRVEWADRLPERFTGLLIAVEWLDVVPVDAVEIDDGGWVRIVEVDAAGEERLGAPVAGPDAAWLDRWWPLDGQPGRRAEIGCPRDAAWRDAAGRLARGLAVAVDYAAVPERDQAGTLTGFRSGRAVRPVPDGSCDITAHVAFESLAGPGDVLLSQREALARLGVRGRAAAYGGDPAAYLAELAHTSAVAELRDPHGLGGFTWLLHPVGIASPL